MGNSQSSFQPAIQALEKLAGPKAVPLNDPLWQTLFSLTTPASRFDPVEVEAAITPHIADLVYNNGSTLNLQRLLFLVSQQLRRCAAAVASGGSFGVAGANAVFLARTVLKDLTEQLNPTQLLAFVELPPAAAAAGAPLAAAGQPDLSEFGEDANKSLVAGLAQSALQVLAANPVLSSGSYLVQLEVIHLLLVLCSTQLFTPSARAHLGAHPYMEAIMQQRDLANPVIETLLGHYIRMPPVPLSLKIYIPTDTATVLRIVRNAAASVLWLPYQAYTLLIRPRASSAPKGPDSPLGDASMLLLLVLVFHAPPQDAPYGNPFRQSLARLQDADEQDAEEDPEGGAAGLAGNAAVPYGALFDSLGRTLSSERAVLLLYALLHGSTQFHEYCLVRSDLDTLLLPLLELLYSAHERTANQMYMLLIILLMLSQDAAFAQHVHRITLVSVPFYRERSGMRTTLGSLLVVLLLRTAHYNLAKLRDVYLHTNTLAALANLAPHMSGLSSHAAQRLVSLLHLLARRYTRLQAAAEGRAVSDAVAVTPRHGSLDLEPSPGGPLQQQQQQWNAAGPGQQQQQQQQPAGGGGTGGPEAQSVAAAAFADAAAAAANPEAAALELQLYADFLRIVLEIVNAVLTSALPHNPELVYTLLQRQDVFVPFREDPRYAELMDNIQVVMDFFNKKIEEGMAAQGGGEMSAERGVAIVQQHSRGWRRDRLRAFPELRFTYEEEANPEEFFLPYVWSLVVAHKAVPWNLEAITLFTPSVLPATSSVLGHDSVPPSPRSTMAASASLDVLPAPSEDAV